MKQRLWFAAKRYGYGWYPITWEGWTVVLGYVVLSIMPPLLILLLGLQVSDAQFSVVFIPYMLTLTSLLIWISAMKGEKARWRWGN